MDLDSGGSVIRGLEQSRPHVEPGTPAPRSPIKRSDTYSEAGSEVIGVDFPHTDCDATLKIIINRTIARQDKLKLKQTDHPKKAQRIERLQRRIDDIQRLIDEGYELVDYFGWYNGKNLRDGKTSEFDTITIKHAKADESITIKLSSRIAYFTHNINTRNFLLLVKLLVTCLFKNYPSFLVFDGLKKIKLILIKFLKIKQPLQI